jgi:hypothetical protein
MPLLELRRSLEERLCGNREELRGILGAVRIQHRRLTVIGRAPQGLELLAEHLCPRPNLRAAVEHRRAVGAAILEVELMRELVQHEVVTIVRVRRAGLRFVPRQHDRPQVPLRVTEQRLVRLGPDPALRVLRLGHVPARVDDDRR